MTKADREQVAVMLQERLPEGWRVDVTRFGLTACGADDRPIGIFNDRAWVDWYAIVAGSDGWHDRNRPRAMGRGWRERLVDDVISAVEAVWST